jgi:hypothetical protein
MRWVSRRVLYYVLGLGMEDMDIQNLCCLGMRLERLLGQRKAIHGSLYWMYLGEWALEMGSLPQKHLLSSIESKSNVTIDYIVKCNS